MFLGDTKDLWRQKTCHLNQVAVRLVKHLMLALDISKFDYDLFADQPVPKFRECKSSIAVFITA